MTTVARTQAADLEPEEIARLTGGRQKRTQIRWLEDNKWIYTLDRHGHPVVSRAYHDRRLGGDTTQKAQPNYGVFSGQKTTSA